MTFEKKIPTMNGVNKNINKDNENNSNKEEKQEQNELKQTKKDENNRQESDVGFAELSKKIEELQQQNAELERKLIYIASEYENSKKRNAKDLDDARKFAISKFAKEVVGLFDILQKAMENVDEKNTDKTLFDGVKMTISEFERAFEGIQIKKIEPEIGSVFNHNQQEAISRVPSELEAGSIVQVIRCGYELYDRLLRPAMVVVSGGK